MESDYSTYFNIHTRPLACPGQTAPVLDCRLNTKHRGATGIHFHNLQINEIIFIWNFQTKAIFLSPEGKQAEKEI